MNKIFKFILIVFFNFLFLMNLSFSEEVKIKIGLLVPLTGENAYLGKQLVKSVRLALKDLNCVNIAVDKNGPMKLRQVAERLGVTTARAQQLEKAALAKLKKLL